MKNGAIKDFKSIMMAQGYWDDKRWNSTEKTYTFETRTTINFLAVDKLGKAKGGRRDTGFVNEAQHAMSGEIFDQLLVRTKEVMWFDWNPSEEFWYDEDIKDKRDHDFLRLTYLDCLDALDQNIIDDIESHKDDVNWWKVYGLGLHGEVEGKIYKGWQIVDEVPHEARLERYGLNFGYSNHDLGLVALYYYNGGYIIDQIMYGLGYSNRNIADILKNEKKALVIADSAEPKSIQEIKDYGISIIGCEKKVKKTGNLGPGSEKSYRNWSIQIVQGEKISVTKRSIDVIREYRNYMWKTDRMTGNILNEPEEPFHYSMDAVRYAVCSLAPVINKNTYRNQNFLNKMQQKIDDKQVNPAR